ncbi:hypothetical protein ACLMJK_003539 [Lecanora helva]
MAIELSKGQIHAMTVTERVTACFSLIGILFIIFTFLLGRGFDKPINRLIFFASWSNMGMVIAALIAQDGIAAGQRSPLCQFQAFAIQMFLGVDALWALCMAFNVYLALFRDWTAKRMRAQEWKYFVGCYGCSFIPALAYLFVKTQRRGGVYGKALLWCWVDSSWDMLRVATLYGIVWVALAFALLIYTMAFAKVWKNRHELRGLFNPFNEDPFEGVVTTEVDITSYARRGTVARVTSLGDEEATVPGVETEDYDPYSVTVEVGPKERQRKPSAGAVFNVRNMTRNHALSETNPDAWLYARVAFLFFCSLLICWVPSSINRLYSIVHPDRLVFWLNYIETLVLPLQGFLNAIVYIITSQTACRNLWRSVSGAQELPRKHSVVTGVNAGSEGRKGESKLERMGMGGADTKLERFTTRRTSERLEGDSSSTTGLRGH